MKPTIPPRIAASGEPVSPDILVVVGLVGWAPPVAGGRPSVPVVGVPEMVGKIEGEDEGETTPIVEDAEGLIVGEEGAVGATLEYDDGESVGDSDGEETVGEV